MGYPTKITTCCYCGARAALVLRGKVTHELSCSSCGAPIHQMKRLEAEPEPATAPAKPKTPKKMAVSHRPPPKSFQKPKKRKKRKSALRWFAEEAWDVIEDILD